MPILVRKYTLYIILLLAVLLRFYNIDKYPSLNPDEAALGYNAYSLIQTGRDEHGISWPLHFKSFGDYKPGLYVYLAIPFVKFLGLNELAVRMPNLILSIFCIYFLYKLIYLLTNNKKLAELSALVLTISPWHIHFSRGAWESSVALSFIIIGTYYFYKYSSSYKLIFFYLFTFFFSLSLYTYHSARIIAPILVVVLFVSNNKLLINKYKQLILPIIFGIIITLPMIFSFLQNGGTTRFGGVGLTADQGPIWRANELINHHQNTQIINRLIHNKRILYTISWAQKYFSHFNFNFLFLIGDEVPRSKVSNTGQLYLIELPLLLLGLVFLFKEKKLIQLKTLLISLLLIAPLASSLTFQAPSALRSLPLTIPFSILIALGIYYLAKIINNKIIIIIFVFIYLFQISNYLHNYYIHYQPTYPFAWNYGFKELINYTEKNKSKYDQIYITNKYDQPYILYLFYSKLDPKITQSQIKLTLPDQYGFSTVNKLNQYNFGKINWEQLLNHSLVIASDEPINSNQKDSINLNNQPIFKIYEK